MKIKIQDKITDLMSPFKGDIIYIDIDNDETLIINHKGSIRKIEIKVKNNDLVETKDMRLLKTTQERENELFDKLLGF